MGLFEDLLPSWKHLDVATQLDRVGHIVRWADVVRRWDSQFSPLRRPGKGVCDDGAGVIELTQLPGRRHSCDDGGLCHQCEDGGTCEDVEYAPREIKTPPRK